jgi:uncharacterized protein
VVNVLLLSLFVAIGSFALGAGMARQLGCLMPFGLLFIAIPFVVGLAVAFPWAPVIHIPLGLVLGWLGFQAGSGNFRGPGQGGWPGGWDWSGPTTSTWDWGSSAGGSGWSGGGFTGGGSDWGGFGGGSSGGGGASGGW